MGIRIRHDDSGFSLIEVLVSALILAIAATGVFEGFDVASRASGRNRARSSAATLAEQDQERLRAMPVSALDGLDSARDVKVCTGSSGGCITYHVHSQSEWVADAGSGASCTSSGRQGYNLHITSTVTRPDMPQLAPVVSDDVVAPTVASGGTTVGTLAVKVVHANGSAVSGMQVALGGGAVDSKPTDSNGCAVFSNLNDGAYTATVDQAGWSDAAGTQHVVQNATVVGQRITSIVITYDQGSTIKVGSFFTKIGATRYPAQVDEVTIYQGTNSRVFGTRNSFQSSIGPTSSFFPGTWNVYAGGCAGNKPPAGQPIASIALPSGVTSFDVPASSNPPGPGLQVPSLDYRITVNSSPPSAANAAWIKLTSTTCTSPTAYVNQQNVQTSGLDAGKVPNPGYPFGTYTVCASAFVNAARRYRSTTANLTTYATALATFNFKNTTSTTAC